MRITPVDIRQQQFATRWVGGYDVQEVDAFLEDVAEDYEQLAKENALLKEQLAAEEEKNRGVAELRRTLEDVLITTRRMVEATKEAAAREAEEMKEAARREAQLLVREAELQGEKILDAARAEEAKIKSEVLALQRTRRQLFESLHATVEMYRRLIAQGLSGEGPEPG